MNRTARYDWLLVSLIILENLFIWVFHRVGLIGQTANATGFLLSSVLVGVVVLAKFHKRNVVLISTREGGRKWLPWIVCIALLLVFNEFTIRVMKVYTPELSSDILPAIKLMVKSLLSGHYPYGPQVLAPIGINRVSNYLPMHWLPFTVAEYFRFDYRSVTFVVWAGAAGWLTFQAERAGDLRTRLIVPLLVTFVYFMVYFFYPGLMGVTIELLTAGYYMLLLIALNRRGIVLPGIMIAVCLLSRYYIVLWLPLWAFVLFISGARRQLLLTSLVVAVVLITVYIFPFLSKDWSVLSHSIKDYQTLPFNEWMHCDGNGVPIHLYDGAGFANYFYEKYVHTYLMTGYLIYKKLFAVMVALTVLALGTWYTFNRKKIDRDIFLLASLKVFMSVCLSFILVPYTYLMVTGVFLSVALYAEQARYRLD